MEGSIFVQVCDSGMTFWIVLHCSPVANEFLSNCPICKKFMALKKFSKSILDWIQYLPPYSWTTYGRILLSFWLPRAQQYNIRPRGEEKTAYLNETQDNTDKTTFSLSPYKSTTNDFFSMTFRYFFPSTNVPGLYSAKVCMIYISRLFCFIETLMKFNIWLPMNLVNTLYPWTSLTVAINQHVCLQVTNEFKMCQDQSAPSLGKHLLLPTVSANGTLKWTVSRICCTP